LKVDERVDLERKEVFYILKIRVSKRIWGVEVQVFQVIFQEQALF